MTKTSKTSTSTTSRPNVVSLRDYVARGETARASLERSRTRRALAAARRRERQELWGRVRRRLFVVLFCGAVLMLYVHLVVRFP